MVPLTKGPDSPQASGPTTLLNWHPGDNHVNAIRRARPIILTCVMAALSAAAVMAQKSSSSIETGNWTISNDSLLEGDEVPDIVVSPGAGFVATRVIDGATLGDLGGGSPFGPAFGAGVLT